MMLVTNLVCLFVGVVLGFYTVCCILSKRCCEGTCEFKLLNKGHLVSFGEISVSEEHYED